MKAEKKFAINCALDEIDACYNKLESKPAPSEETKKLLRGWVRKQKQILSENKYKGKLRTLKRGCG